MVRSDTAQVILDVLDSVEPGVWLSRFSGHSRSLSWKVDSLWQAKFPNRRNRPPYRNVERALETLVAEGLVEKREGENDTYYRKAVA